MLLEVFIVGEGVICCSCVYCLWMVMNGLKVIVEGFEQGGVEYEIYVDEVL